MTDLISELRQQNQRQAEIIDEFRKHNQTLDEARQWVEYWRAAYKQVWESRRLEKLNFFERQQNLNRNVDMQKATHDTLPNGPIC